MIAYRLDKLRAAQTDPTVDLTGRMSHGPRDSHKGGYKRPFDVVPDDSLEQVARDVTLSVFDVPIWGVEALFQRIHTDLGKPNIDSWGATLIIKYSGLDDAEYRKVAELGDQIWMVVEHEVTETRLYPPRNQRREE